MWVADELFVEATRRLREEEASQARLVSEARRAAEQEPLQRAWRWRVETTGQAAPTNAVPWWRCCLPACCAG